MGYSYNAGVTASKLMGCGATVKGVVASSSAAGSCYFVDNSGVKLGFYLPGSGNQTLCLMGMDMAMAGSVCAAASTATNLGVTYA